MIEADVDKLTSLAESAFFELFALSAATDAKLYRAAAVFVELMTKEDRAFINADFGDRMRAEIDELNQAREALETLLSLIEPIN